MNLSLSKKEKENCFKELYQNYYAPFCIYAKKHIDDMAVCEDLVSDVFVNIWDKKVIDYNSKTTLGYIKTCVKNSCINYLRHQQHKWNYNEVVQLQKEQLFNNDTEEIYTLNELQEMLNETINQLPPKYKEVFNKTFYEGKSHSEIAEEMKLSVKSINRYKQKTMEILKGEFKEYLPLLLLILGN